MPLTRRQRIYWLIALIAFQLIYIPINRLVTGGIVPVSPFDLYIPLAPIWVVPYLLSIIWWWGAFVWGALAMDDLRLRAFLIAAFLAFAISYVIWIIYPTYVIRPELLGNDWATNALREVYGNDRVYNAAPSGHTYTTVLISLFWWGWKPRLRVLWAAIAVIVLLSTLFTKQHYIADVITGIALAVAAWQFGWWGARRGWLSPKAAPAISI